MDGLGARREDGRDERLLAVALAIITVAPADLVADAGVLNPEKTTGLAPVKERSP